MRTNLTPRPAWRDSGVHLLLDWVLIIVCKLGLAGAALAVVISQYMASLILLRSLVANKILRLGDLRMLPDITKIFAYLSAGWPAVLLYCTSVPAPCHVLFMHL